MTKKEVSASIGDSRTGHRVALFAAPVLVLLVGLAVAWIDTRPGWDDTGVTAGALFVTAAAGALAGVKPWLSALLVAVPLLIAEFATGPQILLAGAIPLVGACLGAAVRSGVFGRAVEPTPSRPDSSKGDSE